MILNKTIAAIAAYIAAISAANLLVAKYGPAITVVNAFLLIGLDLALRDYLHDLWKVRRAAKMAALIATAGVVSFAINPAAGRIAIASLAAFTVAALIDWAVYSAMRRTPWLARANASNVAGALSDSILFPALAFGWPPVAGIVFGQFIAKTLGGFVWSSIIGGWRAAARHNRAS